MFRDNYFLLQIQFKVYCFCNNRIRRNENDKESLFCKPIIFRDGINAQ